MKITELFQLTEGATSWYLTSGDANYSYLGNNYIATAMGRTESEVKNELSRANIEVSFNIDNAVARRWLTDVIDANVILTVFTISDSDVSVSWKGRLTSVKPTDSQITLIFESVFTSMRRPGLRARFQATCRHIHYGRGCGLNKETFAVAGTLTSASATSVVVTEAALQPDGTYTGGMIKSPDGILRFITNHVGGTLTLIRNVASLSSGTYPKSVTIYPGCDRSRDVCNSRFGNLLNNGSFPFIPTRNPYGGSSFT